MVVLEVPDMSCGHCRAVVEKALAGADPAARVEVDLDTRRVRVDATAATPALIAAIEAAGYPAREAAGG